MNYDRKVRTGFAEKIVHNQGKNSTVRAGWRLKPDEKLHIYTGIRTKDATLHGIVDCFEERDCLIYFEETAAEPQMVLYIDGYDRSGNLFEFARCEGFPDTESMIKWFWKDLGIEKALVGQMVFFRPDPIFYMGDNFNWPLHHRATINSVLSGWREKYREDGRFVWDDGFQREAREKIIRFREFMAA